MKKLTLTAFLAIFSFTIYGQTLIMNEVSQGVTGNMEYVEFVVIDTTVAYDCATGLPPSIDIRGWIFDDNSGYHGSVGIAGGCVRFSLDPFWSNIPIGTIILIYNDAQPEPTIPADDLDMTDGNCLIVAPISNTTLFESNATTPGAIACSYPATGWTPGGNWSNTFLANGGDCARIVDLSGCERFSVCWGTANANTQIYFAGSATNEVYWFNGVDPEDQANWSEGCTDDETILDATQCGSNDQTPGLPNNAANAAYIAQFNNGCAPISPIAGSASVDSDEICSCDGQATAIGSGSIGPYTYEWFDATMTPIGQTTATATGLCAGDYFVTITSSIDCDITEPVTIAPASDLAITSITPINPQCAGDCNGEITVAVTGGTPPYSYQWFDATMTPIGPDAATITGLCAGDYNVEVTDASGAVVTFFTEGFGTGCSQGNLANGTVTVNGTWSTTLTGFNGLGANDWFISATEAGMGAGNCGDGCLGAGPDDRTLHVANVATGYFACFFCPTGDCGAAYSDASISSGFCGVEEDPTMNARAESPVIDCTGESNITLDFEYIFGGQPGVDFCTVEYFDGVAWTTLTVPAQTASCGGGQGLWTALSIPLPASADNNPNVQIGFRWEMVIDDGGTDPSFAVDNITLSSLPGACPVTASTTLTDPTPPTVTATNTSPSCANVSFTVSETGGDAVSWIWTSDGGATITNNTDQTPTITNAVNGETFSVNILDAAGCPGSAQTVVTIDPIPTATISATNGPICSGQDATFTITGTADAVVTYNINGGGSTTVTLSGGTTNITVSGATADQTLTLELVDDGVCSDVLIEALTILVNPLPIVAAVNGGPYCIGDPISVSETGGDATSWSWSSDGLATITNTTDNTPTIIGATDGETFTVVGTDANNCQNSAQTTIIINVPTTGTDVQTACVNYTWIDGITYTASTNTPTWTLTNAAGCDSVVTLDLTIDAFAAGTDVQSACDSYTWIDGNTYTSSNNTATFTYVGGSVNGCDSIVTLDLTLGLTDFGTDVITACNSYTWIDGNTYTANNSTATWTLTNASGCDSVVTLDLTINNSNTGNDVITACNSYTWIDGNTYTASNNTATWTLTNTSGCDSVVTLDLTINNSNTGTDVITACNSYTWIDGNTYTTNNNTATWMLTNAVGCDSVVTLDLTINNSNTGTDVITACNSYTWIDGNTYTTNNNTATWTLTNAAGCDSVITLELTISIVVNGTDVQSSCGPYTWIDGNTYSGSNNTATYTYPGGSVNGCDSIVTLDLTVYSSPLLDPISDTTICGTFDLQTILGSGLTGNESYYDNWPSQGGSQITGPISSSQTIYVQDGVGACSDSLSFEVIIGTVPTLVLNDPPVLCEPETHDLTDPMYVSATSGTVSYFTEPTFTNYVQDATEAPDGVYYIELNNGGCIVTGVLNATVLPSPTAPVAGDDSLYCNGQSLIDLYSIDSEGGLLTWYSDYLLSDVLVTGSSLSPFDEPGVIPYYVTETGANGCESQATTVSITIIDCDITIPTAFTPNGDMNNDNWEIVDLDAVYPDNHVRVYNRWGSLIFEHFSNDGANPYNDNSWDGTYSGENLPVGSYYYVIQFNDRDNNIATGSVSIVLY